MVLDVARRQKRVAPADDALLAHVGRVPVHFELQLVGLHDLGWLGEALTHLGEEGDVAVRLRGVVHQRRVGELRGAQVGRALDERHGASVVPILGGAARGRGAHACQHHK